MRHVELDFCHPTTPLFSGLSFQQSTVQYIAAAVSHTHLAFYFFFSSIGQNKNEVSNSTIASCIDVDGANGRGIRTTVLVCATTASDVVVDVDALCHPRPVFRP